MAAPQRPPQLSGAGLIAPELMARVRQITIRTHRLVNTALAGGYRSVFRGQGIEFEEVRPYQPGDEVRAIDWNVTARAGEPFVKAYREERELSIHALVDTGLPMDFGSQLWTKREAAAQLVGLFGYVAIRNQDRVGLTLFGEEPGLHLQPRKSAKHILRLIREVIAAPVSEGASDLLRVLQSTERALHRRSLVLLLSDFEAVGEDAESDATWAEVLARLGRRHDVIVMRVVDPFEEELPRAGLVGLRGVLGGWREVDSSAPAVRRAWSERAAERRAALNKLLAEAHVDRIEVHTDEDLADPIGRFFRLRASRQRRRA
jgi:uncharacterized protein (DUF58 family)